MTDWPVHARIDGPIVMIGFGSIGKGTLPLIERHFAFDKSRFVVIDPEDKDRKLLDERGIRFIHEAVTKDNYRRSAAAAAHRRRRPGLLRQSFGRHLLARHHGAVQRDRRALHRHRQRAVGRLLLRFQTGAGGALELRPARSHHGGQARAQARQHHRGVLLRRQSRHGVLVRQAGAAQRRRRPQAQVQRAEDPRGMGAGWPGRPASRASTSPSATPSAPSSRSRWTCSSTPGRSRASCPRACSRPNSAGAPTRSGCRRTAAGTRRAARRRSISTQPGANTRVRSWTPTAKGAIRLPGHPQRVDLDRRLFHAARRPQDRATGRPATTPTTRATTRCCRCTSCSGAPARRQERHPHPRRARDRRRHRRARRAALRPREERLLVRLAALDRGDARASRPIRTPPACR